MKYDNKHIKEIVFPVGGIGTGSIGLCGNGMLKDWEIFNRPNKGEINPYSHMALKATFSNGKSCAKVLHGDLEKDYLGQYTSSGYHGYGFGPETGTMAGFNHFQNCSFEGRFPFGTVYLSDKNFPANVYVTAFNPMIPNDSYNSSLPVAIYEIKIENTTNEKLHFDCGFSVSNPSNHSKNEMLLKNNAIILYDKKENEYECGDITLMAIPSSNDQVSMTPYWYRGYYQDSVTMYWNEFTSNENLTTRVYQTEGNHDVASILISNDCEANKTLVFRFVLSWNYPYYINYWLPSDDGKPENNIFKNWYSTIFKNSLKAALYIKDNYNSLYQRTKTFSDAIWNNSFDPVISDAAINSLSVLHSPTVVRLEDGTFYGWEGSLCHEGSCYGSCTHVWNYAYALCYLFPDLERSMRDADFKYNLQLNGAMRFRLNLPIGRNDGWDMPCVDGQMGGIIKLYRDWMICGDDEWLKKNWTNAKKSLDFAFSKENPLEWDSNMDGILEGRQHHTLDMELFGPSSWLESLYLPALYCGYLISKYLGDTKEAKKYLKIYQNGKKWVNENLFNGEYFIQKINLHDYTPLDKYANVLTSIHNQDFKKSYWNDDVNELKYQIGNGCEIDQMLGDWHCALCDLPKTFEKSKTKKALNSIFKYNYFTSFREFTNPWRNFVLNDESGTIMCSYPNSADKPSIPIPYCEETMHGFEYAYAAQLLENKMYTKAIKVIHGVRDRYNGAKRNPFNEVECGNNYARSMSAFSFFPILSGLHIDLVHKKLSFKPKFDNCKCLWSVDGAYGTIEINKEKVTLVVLEGTLRVESILVNDKVVFHQNLFTEGTYNNLF